MTLTESRALDDWDQATKLSDEEAAKLDRWIEEVPKRTFPTAEAAVRYMKKRVAFKAPSVSRCEKFGIVTTRSRS